jgi:hypothetical protein
MIAAWILFAGLMGSALAEEPSEPEPTVEALEEVALEAKKKVKKPKIRGKSNPLWVGRGTPWTTPKGVHSMGVFTPFTHGIGPNTEIEHTGLVSLVAPSLRFKHTLWTGERKGARFGFGFSARVGVPTLVLRLIQASVLPSEAEIPLSTVWGFGLVGGARGRHVVVSWGIQGRAALKAGDFYLLPADIPWFDPMLAPLTEGPAVTLRVGGDFIVYRKASDVDFVVISVESRLHLGGGGPDFNSKLFALVRLGNKTALGAGAAMAYETQTDGTHFYGIPLIDFQLRL